MSIRDNSRYKDVPVRLHTDVSGETTAYIARRFIPPVSDAPLAGRHRVMPTDTIDYVTYLAYDDPTQFWRLADQAGVFDPLTLIKAGQDVGVPRPGPTRRILLGEAENNT